MRSATLAAILLATASCSSDRIVAPAPTPEAVPTVRSARSVAAPLIIVNGKRFVGKLDQLEGDRISSIEVIKGKVATIIYGEAGRNGVVIVTTK